jgi:hypothetical protein
MILFKESSLPASHDSSSDQKPPTSLCMTDEVHRWLDYLAHRHLFDPNYGAKKISLFLFYNYKAVHQSILSFIVNFSQQVVRQLQTEFSISE